jgi:hypothetical protein
MTPIQESGDPPISERCQHVMQSTSQALAISFGEG